MRVLVHHTGSLGDTLVTIPALQALRKHFGPGTQLYMLYNAPPPGRVGVEDVLGGTGLVDRYLPYRVTGTRSLCTLWWSLYSLRFDCAVSVIHTRRTAAFFAMARFFFWCCGIFRTYGFAAYPASVLSPRGTDGYPQAVKHEVHLRLERLYRDGIGRLENPVPALPAPEERMDSVRKWLASRRKNPERPLVALSPGANMPANRWGTDRFIEVGKHLLGRGCEVVILGGPQDREQASQIIAALGSGINAAGEFSVIDSAALLRCCAFLVTVNSGPMHLASAAGVRTVALLGGRDFPGAWDPFGDAHIILRNPVPCGGCQHQVCPVEGHPCMTGIAVEPVKAALDQILKSGA